MLKINQEPHFFTELFYELKSHSSISIKNMETSIEIPKSITINKINNILHHNCVVTPDFFPVHYEESYVNDLNQKKIYKKSKPLQNQNNACKNRNQFSEIKCSQVDSQLNLSNFAVTPRSCYSFSERQGPISPNSKKNLELFNGQKPIAYCI